MKYKASWINASDRFTTCRYYYSVKKSYHPSKLNVLASGLNFSSMNIYVKYYAGCFFLPRLNLVIFVGLENYSLYYNLYLTRYRIIRDGWWPNLSEIRYRT